MAPIFVAQAPQHALVPCGAGKIDDFVGILQKIVEFLGGPRLPKGGLLGRQPAAVVERPPRAGGRRLKHVVDVLSVDAVRLEVPHVHVASVAHGPYRVVALVHAASKAVQIIVGAALEAPHEGNPLHVIGWLDAGHAQHGRRQINEAHQPITGAARYVVRAGEVTEPLGHVDDHRHV